MITSFGSSDLGALRLSFVFRIIISVYILAGLLSLFGQWTRMQRLGTDIFGCHIHIKPLNEKGK